MWPYYDKAIGAAIKEAVEPMMDQYKPPGLIKKIYFSKLTFGDSPIRIDNVWVEDEGENHVLLEVSVSMPFTSVSPFLCGRGQSWLLTHWVETGDVQDVVQSEWQHMPQPC